MDLVIAEDAISKVLSAGGDRATIVSTALQYMGDPYVEGGASHQGIDCSGLTMVAYAAVGIVGGATLVDPRRAAAWAISTRR
ncbi:C40 family peptidase, partial [Bacillus sp. S34]|nr:C40 family peptidase [Bacillus sp. S34]